MESTTGATGSVTGAVSTGGTDTGGASTGGTSTGTSTTGTVTGGTSTLGGSTVTGWVSTGPTSTGGDWTGEGGDAGGGSEGSWTGAGTATGGAVTTGVVAGGEVTTGGAGGVTCGNQALHHRTQPAGSRTGDGHGGRAATTSPGTQRPPTHWPTGCVNVKLNGWERAVCNTSGWVATDASNDPARNSGLNDTPDVCSPTPDGSHDGPNGR